LRLFSFGGYGLALAALALMVLGAIEWPPTSVLAVAYLSSESANHPPNSELGLATATHRGVQVLAGGAFFLSMIGPLMS